MSNEEALIHYEDYGREEGRVSNRLRNREEFVALIPKSAEALETVLQRRIVSTPTCCAPNQVWARD
jgi:hypothetical protein